MNIQDIKVYDKNAKIHTEEQLNKIADSIKRFGFDQAIVVDKNEVIIIGHGRFLAAKNILKWTEVRVGTSFAKKGDKFIPVVKREDLSDLEVKVRRINDNKLNESAWDTPLLIAELKEIATIEDYQDLFVDIENIDGVGLTGFNTDLIIEADEKEDEIPKISEKVKSKLEDIYELPAKCGGFHRIMCGDSVKPEDVNKLMDEKKAELLFTSPPYCDMRNYGGGKNLAVNNLIKFIDVFEPFVNYQVINLGIARKNGELNEYWNDYIKEAKAVGYKFLAWNVWNKNTVSIGQQSAFIPIYHEWILVFGKYFKDINRTVLRKGRPRKDLAKHREADGTMKSHKRGYQDSVFKEMESVICISAVGGKDYRDWQKLHPATYPVDLPYHYINAITNYNEIVVDSFIGSGSTLVACEKANRKCYGMEIDPKYIDICIQRYVNYTGNKEIIKNGKKILWD